MIGLKCRCTNGLSHVNSCFNYYYTINLHAVVDSEKRRKIKKDENYYHKIIFSDFSDILGYLRNPQIFKYSRCMLIVDELLTCPKRPVYRGLRGVMLIG
jgi:hypothetical protein